MDLLNNEKIMYETVFKVECSCGGNRVLALGVQAGVVEKMGKRKCSFCNEEYKVVSKIVKEILVSKVKNIETTSVVNEIKEKY